MKVLTQAVVRLVIQEELTTTKADVLNVTQPEAKKFIRHL